MFVLTFFLPTTINKSEHLKLMNYNFEFFQLGFKEIPICPKRKQALWFGCVFQINCLLSRRPKDQPCRRHFVHCKISFFRENYVFVFFLQNCLISFLGICFLRACLIVGQLIICHSNWSSFPSPNIGSGTLFAQGRKR